MSAMWSMRFRFTFPNASLFLNLTVMRWKLSELYKSDVSLGCHPSQLHGKTRAPFQTSISCHLQVIHLCTLSLPRNASVSACCLQFGMLFYSFCDLFLSSFLDNLVVFCIYVGLPCTHLYPSRSLVRRIWNLVVPVHSSKRLTPFASGHISLIICSEILCSFRV